MAGARIVALGESERGFERGAVGLAARMIEGGGEQVCGGGGVIAGDELGAADEDAERGIEIEAVAIVERGRDRADVARGAGGEELALEGDER